MPECQQSPTRERPHFSGPSDLVETLIHAANSANAVVTDARLLSRPGTLGALRELQDEAQYRRRNEKLRTPRVVVVGSGMYEYPDTASVGKAIVAQTRRLGLHHWIESSQAPPCLFGVELERDHCDACTVRRIAAAFSNGFTL
jgi:hypothetical protein